MKKTLLLTVLSIVLIGCDSGENSEKFDISLDKTEVNLIVGEDSEVGVIGVDFGKCDVYSEDEFIAYAMKYNEKISIDGSHVGETNVIVKYKESEAICKVKVTPSIDFIGSTVTEFGIGKDELKLKVEKPYDRYATNSQTNSTDVSYTRSGYKITDSYYFDNTGLIGVKKTITSTDSDSNTLINITNSMRQRMKYMSNSSTTINSYPKAKKGSYMYSYPDKYYAVYEQIISEILQETGKRPATTNRIYFAKDLETAKEHKFSNLN